MVTFSCDICADVFKKPKSLQHIYRCPNAQLTCIDCSTTFRGDDYLKHTSCVSEAEKYQKSLYKPNKKDKTSNKQKQQKFDTPNNSNKQHLESREQNKTSNNKKILKSSEQDQTPNTTTNDSNNNHSQDNSKKKKKHKNKKDQQQDNQLNEDKISVKGEKEGEKGIAVKVIDNNDDDDKVQGTVNMTKLEENSNLFANNSPKKKRKKNKKTSINNINDNKIEGNKKDSDNDTIMKDSNESMCLNYSQSVQTYENPMKESNLENLNSSSSKKKKKKKNDFMNNNSSNGINVTNGIDHEQNETEKVQSFELVADKKNKKRKSVMFMPGHNELETTIENKKKKINSRQNELENPKIKKQKTDSRQCVPETSIKNKKQETNEEDSRKARKAESSHENGNAHNLSDYESIPAAVKKIFKSNNHEELNLKRLEEMVAQELNSNLSASEMKEIFLENIVLVMKDGNIILK